MKDEETPGTPSEPMDDEILKEIDDDLESRKPSGAQGWVIAVAVHALIALIFWAVVFAAHVSETELPPMRVTTIDSPPLKQEKKEQEKTLEQQVEINVAEADTRAPVSTLDVAVEEKTISEDVNDAEVNKGREEAVASAETGSTGAFMAIGAGGGSAGMFGSRSGGGKRRALAKGGGSQESESAVDAALHWFKRHQSPNGMWDVIKYSENCTEAPKCEPGDDHNAFGSDANVAMTGYAVLCFLGAGYDHKTPNKYRTTVQKGLSYLCSVQQADGLMGRRNYEHAVATMALAEAFAMTSDGDLRMPAQNGVNVVLARQNKDAKAAKSQVSGLGWDYVDSRPERNDSSVTGWNVMALKSGLAGGLNVGTGMEGAKIWLERAWKAANSDWAKLSDPYAATSSFPYCWNANTDAVEIGKPGSDAYDMAPVAALCAVFLGHHAGDMMLESLCNHIMTYQFPTAYPCNTYYMYYNTLALFQVGGDRWKKWNDTVRDMLIKAQRRGDGCFDGSWNWEGTKFCGAEMGRVLSTAYCCLSLEVYYRYKQTGAATELGKRK